MDKKQLRRHVSAAFEKLLRHVFFWTRNEKEFGYAVIGLHIALFWIVLIPVIAVQIIRVPGPLLIVVFMIFMLLLLQEHFVGGCILSSIEKRVLGAPYPIFEPILEYFNIPVSVESIRGVSRLLMMMCLGFFGLQMIRSLI